MTIQILALLIITSTVFFIFNRRKIVLGLQFISLLWLLVCGNGIVAKIIMNHLEIYPRQEKPIWKNKNAIVLLSGGSFKWKDQEAFATSPMATSRLLEAARLYYLCLKAGPVCKIIPTGGDPLEKGRAEAQIMADQLMDLGIPEADILPELKSKNTFENAKFTAPLLSSNSFDQIYLVTSGSHLMRSMILFQHFNVKAIAAPADKYNFRWQLIPSASNFHWADIGIHEWGGMTKFYLFNFLGWDY